MFYLMEALAFRHSKLTQSFGQRNSNPDFLFTISDEFAARSID